MSELEKKQNTQLGNAHGGRTTNTRGNSTPNKKSRSPVSKTGKRQRKSMRFDNSPRERICQMNTYYHTCPDCGAHLDPGEICDCEEEKNNA